MANQKDTALVDTLLKHPEVVSGLASLGVKLTQTSKSLTLRFEKGSYGWEQFVEGWSLGLKKKDVKKNIMLLLRSGLPKPTRGEK